MNRQRLWLEVLTVACLVVLLLLILYLGPPAAKTSPQEQIGGAGLVAGPHSPSSGVSIATAAPAAIQSSAVPLSVPHSFLTPTSSTTTGTANLAPVEERVNQQGLIPEVRGGQDAALLNPRFPPGISPGANNPNTQGTSNSDLQSCQQNVLKVQSNCGYKVDLSQDLTNNRLSVRYWPVRPLISTLGPNELYLTTDDFSTPIINTNEPRTAFYTQPLPGSDRSAGLSTSETVAQAQHNYDRTL